ncbi:MAG: hypothetical protein RMK20_12845, partial [Verrucomicrobiales bacterium]|nr:hypothetical protein [Verrucomicrobiales bacterium]
MKLFRFTSLLLALLTLSPLTPQSPAAGFIVADPAHWTVTPLPEPEIWPPPPPPRPPHPPPPPWPPRPIPPPRPHVFAPLEVTSHHVTVNIDGQLATTTVEQEFYNPNPAPI